MSAEEIRLIQNAYCLREAQPIRHEYSYSESSSAVSFQADSPVFGSFSDPVVRLAVSGLEFPMTDRAPTESECVLTSLSYFDGTQTHHIESRYDSVTGFYSLYKDNTQVANSYGEPVSFFFTVHNADHNGDAWYLPAYIGTRPRKDTYTWGLLRRTRQGATEFLTFTSQENSILVGARLQNNPWTTPATQFTVTETIT